MKEPNYPNVLLIILDCARPDRMSCYGYHKNTTPNLKMISSESTIFENAISAAPWTLPSHASMFTGLYPSEHEATVFSSKMRSDVKTLAEIMSESGYETVAVCQNSFINKPSGTAKGFNTFYGWEEIITPNFLRSYFGSSQKDLPGLGTLIRFYNFVIKEDVTSLSISLCKRILKKNKNNPIFLFVNIMSAHLPYYLGLPTISLMAFFRRIMRLSRLTIKGTYLANDPMMRQYKQLATKKEFTEDEFQTMNNFYDACLHYMDCQLGELFKFMKKEEILDRTLLIITSDHGENIGDHKLISHNLSVHDSLVKVPLIVRYPDMFPKNKRIIKQVETRSIFHTILNVTSISMESTGQIKGKSLLRAIKSRNMENYTFGEYTPSNEVLSKMAVYSSHIDTKDASMRRFIRGKDFKFVKYENGEEELYDLRIKERKVSPKKQPQIFNRLKNKLEMWEESLNMHGKSVGRKRLSEEEDKKKIEGMIKKRLKVLGYL